MRCGEDVLWGKPVVDRNKATAAIKLALDKIDRESRGYPRRSRRRVHKSPWAYPHCHGTCVTLPGGRLAQHKDC